MVLLGGVPRILIGFSLGILFAGIIFANSAGWADAVPVALAALGALAGSSLARRFAAHRMKAHRPALRPVSR
jgi:hypothetical protein